MSCTLICSCESKLPHIYTGCIPSNPPHQLPSLQNTSVDTEESNKSSLRPPQLKVEEANAERACWTLSRMKHAKSRLAFIVLLVLPPAWNYCLHKSRQLWERLCQTRNLFIPIALYPCRWSRPRVARGRHSQRERRGEAKPRTSARPQLPFCARHLRELLNAKWMLPWDTDFTEIPSWKQFPPCTCYLQVSRVCSFAVFVVLFIFTTFSSPPPPLQGDDGEQESTTQRVPWIHSKLECPGISPRLGNLSFSLLRNPSLFYTDTHTW